MFKPVSKKFAAKLKATGGRSNLGEALEHFRDVRKHSGHVVKVLLSLGEPRGATLNFVASPIKAK